MSEPGSALAGAPPAEGASPGAERGRGWLRTWPSAERLAWIDRRFAVYIVALGISNGLFSIAAKIGWDFDIFWEAARNAAASRGAYATTLAMTYLARGRFIQP